MEGQSFFAGLLKGFGSGVLDNERQRQTQHLDGQKQLLDLYLKGIQDEQLDPQLGYTHIAGLFQDYFTGGLKNTKNALAALADPENFGQFAAGVHTTLGGQKVRTGKVGPTGLPGVGPVPMGGTNPPEMRPESTTPPDYGQGRRWDPATKSSSGAPKGLGFLGPLRTPDGGVMSEFSTGVEFNGQEVEIPTVVPTLTREEVEHLLQMKEGDPLPDSIRDKAVTHAQGRLAEGKDPFAGRGEQQVLYPDLAAPTPAEVGGLEGRSTMVGPPARLWNTPAERQRLQTEAVVGKQQALTAGEIKGKVQMARELYKDGTAKSWAEALAMAGMPAAAGAREGDITARSLFNESMTGFKELYGREPTSAERNEMLEHAIKRYKELDASAANPQQMSTELRARTEQLLAKDNIGWQQATEAQRQQYAKTAATQLELERSKKGDLTKAQQVSHSLTLRRMFNQENMAALVVARSQKNLHSSLDAVKKGARTPGSIAIITDFNKSIDPNSVVMVSEFGRSREGLALADRLTGMANDIIKGGVGVPDAILEQYVALADAFAENIYSGVDAIAEEYEAFAGEYGLNKAFVTKAIRPGIGPGAPPPPAAEPPPATPPPTPPTPAAPAARAQRPVHGITRDPVTGGFITTPAR